MNLSLRTIPLIPLTMSVLNAVQVITGTPLKEDVLNVQLKTAQTVSKRTFAPNVMLT